MKPAIKPILLDFPDTLETERLILRAPRPGDGQLVFEAVAETLDDLRRWPASLPWALAEPSPDVSEVFCRHGCAAWITKTDLPMLVFLKEGNVLVGGSGLHSLDWTVPKFEVGYWMRRRMQGRGLATEAVIAVTEFAQSTLGARRIEILSDAENAGSRRVAERAGYVLEGIQRSNRIAPDGELRDTCIYAAVK